MSFVCLRGSVSCKATFFGPLDKVRFSGPNGNNGRLARTSGFHVNGGGLWRLTSSPLLYPVAIESEWR